jgi:hypothetical protein
MKKMLSLLLTLALVGATTGPSGATVLVDYVGYAFETGGLLPSDPGDELVFTALATNIDPLTGVDLGTAEVTFHVYGLISTGQGTDPFGNAIITYNGGTLEVWRDYAQNADWGINPPNATSPSTFADGELLFQGNFVSFMLAINPSIGAGAYEGYLDGVGGTLIQACTGCAYTWGGAFDQNSGAQILEGYDLQIDGVLEVDGSVDGERTGWGSIKSLYRD